MDTIALTNGDVLLIAIAISIPLAVLSFIVGAGHAMRQIGKGQFGVQFEQDLPQKPPEASPRKADREAEIRQMVEAKAYRQEARGKAPLDIDAEVERLLEDRPAPSPGADEGLRDEVRQLVVARNERRLRKGEEPLDVEAEVERQLHELESLGQ